MKAGKVFTMTDLIQLTNYIKKVHTSVFIPVGVLGSIFGGEIINCLDGVHFCMDKLADSTADLMSA